MKKTLALLLALIVVLSLAACGSDASAAPASEPAASEPTDSAVIANNSDAEISDEQLAALAEAYNEIAPQYNEMYDAAESNGWLEDEQTAAELQVLSGTLGMVGSALTEDPSILDGSDFDALPDALRELIPGIEEMVERVSVPYEG